MHPSRCRRRAWSTARMPPPMNSSPPASSRGARPKKSSRGRGGGMAEILRGLGEYQHKGREGAARKPGAVAAVNPQLSAAGLDMGDVTTGTFAARIDQFERVERMLAA